VEAARCSDYREQCGDTRAESDICECLVAIVCVLKMEALDRQRQLERELLDTMDRKVRSQERLLAVKDATIAELELRVTSLEQTSYDGTLLWRITDFQRKRQDAISGRVTSVYSPPFFTSRTGKSDTADTDKTKLSSLVLSCPCRRCEHD